MSDRRTIVFDVDGVLANGSSPSSFIFRGRPEIQTFIDTLACLGYHLVAWSAGGEQHAREVCEALVLHGAIREYARKPEYPIDPIEAEVTIGRIPALQIDDDMSERVPGWPFMVWPGFYERSPDEVDRAIRGASR